MHIGFVLYLSHMCNMLSLYDYTVRTNFAGCGFLGQASTLRSINDRLDMGIVASKNKREWNIEFRRILFFIFWFLGTSQKNMWLLVRPEQFFFFLVFLWANLLQNLTWFWKW